VLVFDVAEVGVLTKCRVAASGTGQTRGGSASECGARDGSSGQAQVELVSNVNANQWFVVTAERIPGKATAGM
jgi:hypothetical protein